VTLLGILGDTTMLRRTIGLLITLALGLLGAPVGAEAPAPAKIPRIAVLGFGPPPSASAPQPFVEAFQNVHLARHLPCCVSIHGALYASHIL
jgi:hypothetical protein